MFFDRLKKLCDEKGVSPYKACTDVGLNRAAVAKWKNGSIPNGQTLAKIAEYFGVTAGYLLGAENRETPPTLNARDERDIAKNLEALLSQLDSGNDLMFDGDPMSDEAKESIRAAMKLGLEAAKLKNKERFTPNKYKKG